MTNSKGEHHNWEGSGRNAQTSQAALLFLTDILYRDRNHQIFLLSFQWIDSIVIKYYTQYLNFTRMPPKNVSDILHGDTYMSGKGRISQ